MENNEGILILLPQPCFYYWQSPAYLALKVEEELKKYSQIPFYERKPTVFQFITNKENDEKRDIFYEQFWKVTTFEKNASSKVFMKPLETIRPADLNLKDVIF